MSKEMNEDGKNTENSRLIRLTRIAVTGGLLIFFIIYRAPVFDFIYEIFGERRIFGTVAIFAFLTVVAQIFLVDLFLLIGLSSDLGSTLIGGTVSLVESASNYLAGQAGHVKVAASATALAPLIILPGFLSYISIEECEEWCNGVVAEVETSHEDEMSEMNEERKALLWELESSGESWARTSGDPDAWSLPPVEAVLARVALLIETRSSGPQPNYNLGPVISEMSNISKALASCSERLADARKENDKMGSLMSNLGNKCDAALGACTSDFRGYLQRSEEASTTLTQAIKDQDHSEDIKELSNAMGAVSSMLGDVNEKAQQLCQGVETLGRFGESQAGRVAWRRIQDFWGGAKMSSPLEYCQAGIAGAIGSEQE